MDEKAFKKHLKGLAEGQHHPEEHDWDDAAPAKKAPAKTGVPKRGAKRGKSAPKRTSKKRSSK